MVGQEENRRGEEEANGVKEGEVTVEEAEEIAGFFFSSRERHTRLRRDWSSDVCSSDLDCPGTQRLFGDRQNILLIFCLGDKQVLGV